jgi:hypothetical protein
LAHKVKNFVRQVIFGFILALGSAEGKKKTEKMSGEADTGAPKTGYG